MSINECFLSLLLTLCGWERTKKYEVAPVLKGEARCHYAADGNPLVVNMATVQLRHEDI